MDRVCLGTKVVEILEVSICEQSCRELPYAPTATELARWTTFWLEPRILQSVFNSNAK